MLATKFARAGVTTGREPERIEIRIHSQGRQDEPGAGWTSADYKVLAGQILPVVGCPPNGDPKLELEYTVTTGLDMEVESGANHRVAAAAVVAGVGEHTLFVTTPRNQRKAPHRDPHAHGTRHTARIHIDVVPTPNTNFVACRRLHSNMPCT